MEEIDSPGLSRVLVGSNAVGMETMKAYLLESALVAACLTSTAVVVWWGLKILAA